jgi:hypothetical protein
VIPGDPGPPGVFVYQGKVMAVLRAKDGLTRLSGLISDLRMVGILAVDHQTILDPATLERVDECRLGDGFAYYEDVRSYFEKKREEP